MFREAGLEGRILMQDLWAEARSYMAALDEELARCRSCGAQLAENERAYRVALACEELRLKEEGRPVSIIGDVARGVPEIAELKCARDCSEAFYKASTEAINVLKLKLRTVNEEMGREWNSGSDGL